jgi:hypothetical protein
MTLLVLADDLAGFGIQRGKQAGRSVPRIVVSAALDRMPPANAMVDGAGQLGIGYLAILAA